MGKLRKTGCAEEHGSRWTNFPTRPATTGAIRLPGIQHRETLRQARGRLGGAHRFFALTYQLQRPGTEDLTGLFKRLPLDLGIGRRSNIEKYEFAADGRGRAGGSELSARPVQSGKDLCRGASLGKHVGPLAGT